MWGAGSVACKLTIEFIIKDKVRVPHELTLSPPAPPTHSYSLRLCPRPTDPFEHAATQIEPKLPEAESSSPTLHHELAASRPPLTPC